jgi:Fe/S biogenesis protein NfuA
MADLETTALEPVVFVSETARSVITDARAAEADPERLALYIEVGGVANGAYTYDMWFQATVDAAPGDAVHHHDDLAIVVLAESVDRLRGATLDVGDAGLMMLNPNSPPPDPATSVPRSDLSSPLEKAVLEVLESEINPQIATHGGHAELVAVDENRIAYLVLSGGCQGCGMAAVTLRQGIAVAIKEAVPEIADIVDVTAHADGTAPYIPQEQHAHHH